MLERRRSIPECNCKCITCDRQDRDTEIYLCRLHAEAPAMYEDIKTTMDDLNTIIDHIISGYSEIAVDVGSEIAVDVARQMQSRIGALLARIEGRDSV